MSHSSVPTDKDCCGVCGHGDTDSKPLVRCEDCGAWACPDHYLLAEMPGGRRGEWACHKCAPPVNRAKKRKRTKPFGDKLDVKPPKDGGSSSK